MGFKKYRRPRNTGVCYMRVPTLHKHLGVLLSDDRYGDPILYQSSAGETGQLMGTNKRTLAWEVFYKSFLYRVQVSGVSSP